VDDTLKLRDGYRPVLFDPSVPMPVIVINASLDDPIQEGLIEIQTMAEVAPDAILRKRMLHLFITTVLKLIEQIQPLFKHIDILLDQRVVVLHCSSIIPR